MKGSANTADDDDSEEDEVFTVEYQTNCELLCSIPGLLSTKSLDEDTDERSDFIISDKDWFSEIDEKDLPQTSDWEIEPAAPHSESDTDSCMEVTVKVVTEHKEGTIVELYDSGTTRHISPYCEQF
jgi:hypothetical protein